MLAHAIVPSVALSRREFLAGLPAAGALAQETGYAPMLASQVYVWRQQLSAEKKPLSDNLERIFSGTARAGFQRVELDASFFKPELAEETARRLRRHKLEVPIVYNGGPMHMRELAEATWAETLEMAEAAKTAGAAAVNFNASPKPDGQRKSDAELKTQAYYIDQLAEELALRHMHLFLHQHALEMAENAREWRHLLANTNPATVSFCVDVDWVLRGKQDPMTIIEEARRRLASLHLRNSVNGVWTEAFGPGDIDYQNVADYLKATAYRGYLVVELAYVAETRKTRSLEDNLKESRRYAEKIFGLNA